MPSPATEPSAFKNVLGPSARRLVDSVEAVWPEHAKFLRQSFTPRGEVLLETTEVIASLLIKVAADRGRHLEDFAQDYRYLCEKIVYPEELFFRREGRYRLSTFAEAAAEVYDNAELMTRYMDGLFMSDALWLNHASAMNDFATAYLPGAKTGGRHLEIGPGHGMLLHLANRHGAFSSLSAWDVSETSIAHTRHVLGLLGESERVDVKLQDLYSPQALEQNRGRFDTIVLSEVLEHLERPEEAIAIIRDLLAPGGTVWINVPANGPAPDHLFLLRSLAEVIDLVAAAGLTVTRSEGFPVAGSTLERAIRQELPISCVVVGAKAPDVLFNSLTFVFIFLPLALLVFWALGKTGKTSAKLVLVVASLVFYAWAGPRQLPLLLLSLAFTWVVGAMINRARIADQTAVARAWLVLGVVVDTGLLIWFKYADFVSDNLDAAFGTNIALAHIALPLAISFFTFQEIAYLVDTARGETGTLGPLDFAVFTTFFPKLISGPIVRYREFVPQIQTRRWGGLRGRNAMIGLVMFAIGLFKKTVIADTLSPYTAALYDSARSGHPSLLAAWLAAIVFSLQVYFDFSGYSDMAIGAGRMFGIKLPLNFHSPFRAASIIDYWRRWHMTLQRFVVSYIFQPMSLPLNRYAAGRGLKGWNAFWLATFLPIFTAFLILGIWHGAGWTFVVFGTLQGVYVGVNEAWREFGKQRRRRMRRAGVTVGEATVFHRIGFHALTLAAILYANVMFHARGVGEGLTIWRGMTGFSGLDATMPAGVDWPLGVILAAALAMVFLFPNSQQIMGRYDPAINWREWSTVARPPIAWTWKPDVAGIAFAGAILFLGVMFIQSGRAVFLYFNF